VLEMTNELQIAMLPDEARSVVAAIGTAMRECKSLCLTDLSALEQVRIALQAQLYEAYKAQGASL